MSSNPRIVTSVPLKMLSEYKKIFGSISNFIDDIITRYINDTGWSSDECVLPSFMFKTALKSVLDAHEFVTEDSDKILRVEDLPPAYINTFYNMYSFDKSKYILNMEYNTWKMLMSTGKQISSKEKEINIDILKCLPYKTFYIHLDNHPTLDGVYIVKDTMLELNKQKGTHKFESSISLGLVGKDSLSVPTTSRLSCMRLSLKKGNHIMGANENALIWVNSLSEFNTKEISYIVDLINYDKCDDLELEYNAEDNTASVSINTIRVFTDFISGILQILYYICTITADAVKVSNPIPDDANILRDFGNTSKNNTKKNKKKKSKPRKAKSICTYYDIGYRLGPVLKEHEEEIEAQDTDGRKGHGTKKLPHIRRGHFHTYHVGKGREKTIVKWLAPTYINGSCFKTELPVVERGIQNTVESAE